MKLCVVGTGYVGLVTGACLADVGNTVWCVDTDAKKISSLLENKIPIYVPGITDGAVGSQLWMFRQTHRDFVIDVLKDEDELAEIVFKARRTGALIVGGGISKHHTIWWNQFKGGLDYTIYLTTAVEWDGSLSGAKVREAISWGKVKETAKHITIEGDATIILPLMIASIITEK
jgi:deoxyhypusine synthase